MTILLHNHLELQERAPRHLRAWKACHLVLYSLAAIFGLVNYVLLQNTIQLVDDNCVLFPRELEFHLVKLPDTLTAKTDDFNTTDDVTQWDVVPENNTGDATVKPPVKREVKKNEVDDIIAMIANGNGTGIAGNASHRIVLDTSRTLFETGSVCQFAEFMPIMSTIFSVVWLTLFTMCAGGGHVRSGLQQPWSILTPALLFALVMVGLTGHSFTSTNSGLHAFCESFVDITNSTTCSSVDPYLERGWNASWGFSGRAAATRAASAAVWAAWACAATLFLARCLAAPDFEVKRTAVHLTKDPQQKIIPHLKKSPTSQLSSHSSPTKRDTVSMRSEPTVTTELVSASAEPGADSAPSSLLATPARKQAGYNSDMIEMTYSPTERFIKHH